MNTVTMAHTGGRRQRLHGTPAIIRRGLEASTPVGDLLLRCWTAYAFFASGLTKIQSWDSTLYLFSEEYSVPLLPPEVAACLGAITELLFPALLAVGLCGRLAAGVLFVFNIIAVISYPDLGAAGLEQHKVWGVMLLVCLLHGPGKIAADHWLHKHLRRP